MSPRAYEDLLWRNVLAQYVVCSTRDSQPRALVAGYAPDHANQHCSILAFRVEPSTGPYLVIEGISLLVAQLFETWQFRKLYFETDTWLVDQFPSIQSGRFGFVEEGRLRDHVWRGTGYADKLIYALYRSSWENAPLWQAFRGRPARS